MDSISEMDSQVQGAGGPKVIKVTSVEHGKELIAANPVVVLGFFVDQSTDMAKAFFTTANQVDFVFALVTASSNEDEIIWKLGADDQDILLWKNSNSIYYKGASNTEEIITWLKKKTSPPIEVTTAAQAKEVIAANDAVVFGFFADQDTDRAKTFLTVAGLIHEEVFAIVSDHKDIAELEAGDQDVVIFKKFDENRVKYKDEKFTEDALKFWVVVETTPILYVSSGEPFVKLYEIECQYSLQLYLSKKNGDFEKYIDKLKPVAKKYRDKIPISVVIDVDVKEHERDLDFMGVKKEEVPCIRLIVEVKDNYPMRYKPSSDDLTPESIEEFIQSFFAGELKPHWKSQELTADWNKNPVKVLVASNFDEVVFDTNKKVLVDFFAPWCPPCKELEPIYNKLGEHFEKDEDVVIAKIDAYNNEVENAKIRVFPTIRFYTKDNQVREYDIERERTLENLIKFVESDGVEGAASESAPSEGHA